MARGSDLLDDKTVKAKTKPGHYRDSRGLYLQVSVWGTKSWARLRRAKANDRRRRNRRLACRQFPRSHVAEG